jgi:lysophospholipase L1-like esterase
MPKAFATIESMHTLVLYGDSLLAEVGKDRISMFEETLAGYDVYNCAVGGWDTNDCLKKAPYIAKLEPDVIVISLGTNDSASWKHVPLEVFAGNLRKIAEVFHGSKVIYFLPPPVNETDTKTSGWPRSNDVLKQYHDAAKSVCQEQTIAYIDSFAVFMPLLDAGKEYHAEDGVHLTDTAYQTIAAELVKIIS